MFAAFSGSHQDAIAKGMTYYRQHEQHEWNCPYIPIDPTDIGRTYDADVIRINSQSGKGGIGFLLEQNYGYNPPPKMREALGYAVKNVSDHAHKELSVKEVLEVFENTYLNKQTTLRVEQVQMMQKDGVEAAVTYTYHGTANTCTASGNGSLDAFANAIRQGTGLRFRLEHYSEHSLDQKGTGSVACSYVGLVWEDGSVTWGAGTDTDIIYAGIRAMVSAINNRF